jgi:hypothetical protein
MTAYVAVLDEPNDFRRQQIKWVAESMGADFVVIGGKVDTSGFYFADVRTAKTYLDGVWVPLELTSHSQPLDTFTHPERAIYLLGSQTGTLSRHLLSTLPQPVRVETQSTRRRVIPTPVVAGIVLHHRLTQKVSA